MEKSKLDSVVKSLSAAKTGIIEAVVAAPASPSIQHTAQVTVDMIDTAYLWCSQLAYFLDHLSEKAVEEAVEKATAEGTVIVGDFSNPPKAQ